LFNFTRFQANVTTLRSPYVVQIRQSSRRFVPQPSMWFVRPTQMVELFANIIFARRDSGQFVLKFWK